MRMIDKFQKRGLFVVDEQKRFLGTITDGDIRRYILQNKDINGSIKNVYNKKPIFIRAEKYTEDLAKKIFIRKKIELIPILDRDKKIIKYVSWDETFSDGQIKPRIRKKLSIPVVIMSGGKGMRMEPFTKIIPKPLIPIGDKTILEIIIEEFKKYGMNSYYFTLNYRGKMIESYFNAIKKDYKLNYIWEEDYLGTAGSLKLLENTIGNTFIVSNCDIVVKADYREVIKFHKKQNADMTILSSVQNYKIPYGIISFKKGGQVIEITEKPEYTFIINTGVYILQKECLKFIQNNTYIDMPDLIKKIIDNNKKVITYPVKENDYIDIGQWEEYKKTVDKLKI